MAEAAPVEVPATPTKVERTNLVVTSSGPDANFNQWVDQQLGIGNDGPEGGQGTDTINPDPVEEAKKELEALKPKPKEGDVDGAKVFFNGEWVGKNDFKYRVHVKSQDAIKEAAEARTKAESEAKAARERADKAEAEALALKQRYEPPQNELGPEPTPEQFANPAEYGKALKDWTAEATRREDRARAAEEQRVKSWKAEEAKVREEIPSFDEDVQSAANTPIMPHVAKAVLELGPRMLHHLAKNPDTVKALNSMAPERALVELGVIKASFAAKPEAKPEPKPEPKAKVAEMSRAPAPISPIKEGSDTGAVRLKGSDPVPQGMSYDDWKALRQKGAIQ